MSGSLSEALRRSADALDAGTSSLKPQDHKFIAGTDESPRVFVRIREATETTPADVIGYYQRGN